MFNDNKLEDELCTIRAPWIFEPPSPKLLTPFPACNKVGEDDIYDIFRQLP